MTTADYKRAANELSFLRIELILLSELGIGPMHPRYLEAVKDAALVEAFFTLTRDTEQNVRDVMRRNKHLYQ